jgi:hypothetical protein
MTDPSPATETSAPTGSSEAIIARVDGTRPCLRCGHDLHGQSIVREPEYGLFIARCSECGTVAAMTEYPTLGVWGRRLGIALMTVMIALLIPVALLSALAIFGIASVIFDERIHAAREVLNIMLGGDSQMLGGDGQVTPAWWSANGADARRRMTEAFFQFDRGDLMLVVATSPVAVLIGMIWSGLLVGLPRRRLWLAGPVLGVIACAYVGLAVLERDTLGVTPVWLYSAAFTIMAWPGMGSIIVLQTGLLIVGLLFGRTLTRWLATFALPPRARRLVSFLWTVDGLDPPRGRG